MLDDWLESIKTMSIFLVCAQVLIHFKPKGAYEKYIRLLVSIMLLVQLLEPIGNLLGIWRKGELQNKIHNIERRLEWIQQQTYDMEERSEKIWDMFLQDAQAETEIAAADGTFGDEEVPDGKVGDETFGDEAALGEESSGSARKKPATERAE